MPISGGVTSDFGCAVNCRKGIGTGKIGKYKDTLTGIYDCCSRDNCNLINSANATVPPQLTLTTVMGIFLFVHLWFHIQKRNVLLF